ncbi:MAG TPA: SagB/ThcOx family dehydrogenase [Thermoanaerobaculia bacterium]|nr:SagB/ThcOx family dehydrogenase [Thermoanaerobaculia bacterium]
MRRKTPAVPDKVAASPDRRPRQKLTLDEFFARELPPLSDVVTFCNNLPMSLYADSTGVKSPEVVFRGLVLSQNRLVAEEYLLNFRRSEADLGVVIGTNNYSLPTAVGAVANRDLEEDERDLIPLPPYQNVRAPLGSVVRSRRSGRRYSGKPLTLEELSTLLFHAGGISGHLHLENLPETVTFGADPRLDLRTAVSGGALYPVDLFVLAQKIEGLPPRAYRYLPKPHALKPVGPAILPALRRLAQWGEIEVEKAGFLLGYVYNLFENARKYGEAAMGFAFIEAGAIAAHVHLLCTALGLASCDVGSFVKNRFEPLFEADGLSRHMIHLTVVGNEGRGA